MAKAKRTMTGGGSYNYRGYQIERIDGRWISEISRNPKTLKDAKFLIDQKLSIQEQEIPGRRTPTQLKKDIEFYELMIQGYANLETAEAKTKVAVYNELKELAQENLDFKLRMMFAGGHA